MVAASREIPGTNVIRAWEALRDEALGCTRCSLYLNATQTVFGEGPLDAPLMFVGEQPGDQEDRTGKPFVGPAGLIFDQALAKAGIDRALSYVTNAVKHFKYEQRGKRRIHSKPNAGEIQACRWWYGQERELLRPAVTVALGATAARQMLGKAVTIAATRGMAHRLDDDGEGWVTIHPSFLLRIRERDEADAEFGRFVEDLKRVKDRVDALS
jgi:DNA polymerase